MGVKGAFLVATKFFQVSCNFSMIFIKRFPHENIKLFPTYTYVKLSAVYDDLTCEAPVIDLAHETKRIPFCCKISGDFPLYFPVVSHFKNLFKISLCLLCTKTALKIHMSQSTKEILDKHERFLMEERGTIDVKVCQLLAHTELLAQYFILKLTFSNFFSLSNLFSFQFSHFQRFYSPFT